jgi:hypothetical protein
VRYGVVRYGPRGRVYAGVRAAERRWIVRERGACQRILEAGCRLRAQSRAGHEIGILQERITIPLEAIQLFPWMHKSRWVEVDVLHMDAKQTGSSVGSSCTVRRHHKSSHTY